MNMKKYLSAVCIAAGIAFCVPAHSESVPGINVVPNGSSWDAGKQQWVTPNGLIYIPSNGKWMSNNGSTWDAGKQQWVAPATKRPAMADIDDWVPLTATKPWYSIMHWDGDCSRIDNASFGPDKLIASMRKVGGDAVDITDPNDASWPEFFVRLPSGRIDGLIFIRGETECTALALAMRIKKEMPYQERMDDPTQPGRKG